MAAAPLAGAQPVAPNPTLPQSGGTRAIGGSSIECVTPGNVSINATPVQQQYVGPWGSRFEGDGLFLSVTGSPCPEEATMRNIIRLLAPLCAVIGLGTVVVLAPAAGAAPQCTDVGPTTTLCQTNGSAQIVTSPPVVNNNFGGYPFWGGGVVIDLGGFGFW